MQTDLNYSLRLQAFPLEIVPPKKGLYIVGGCLRDYLLGRYSPDIDITVDGDPQTIAHDLASRLNSRVICLGKAPYHTYRVVTPQRIYDVTAMQGVDIEEDLNRRDFTINAMALGAWNKSILNYSKGLQDIQNKRIRHVSETSFKDDPVRLLRAFRIAAQLDFQIEKKTLVSLGEYVHYITTVAGERVHHEINAILQTSRAEKWFQRMANCGLLFQILPELEPLKGFRPGSHPGLDAFSHSLCTLYHMESLISLEKESTPVYRRFLASKVDSRPEDLKLAALLHDIGQPASRHEAIDDSVQFLDHDNIGADMVAGIANRLKFSHQRKNYLTLMIGYHMRPMHLFRAHKTGTLTQRDIIRFFLASKGITQDILLLSIAHQCAKKDTSIVEFSEFEQFAALLSQRYEKEFKPSTQLPGLINGHDLRQKLNLSPSPLFKRILSRVRERQLVGEVTSRKEALALAAKMAGQSSP